MSVEINMPHSYFRSNLVVFRRFSKEMTEFKIIDPSIHPRVPRSSKPVSLWCSLSHLLQIWPEFIMKKLLWKHGIKARTPPRPFQEALPSGVLKFTSTHVPEFPVSAFPASLYLTGKCLEKCRGSIAHGNYLKRTHRLEAPALFPQPL